jgi:purine-binding chemotaxis protein CheW
MTTETIGNTTQYLSFQLADELFSLNIGKVREVIEFTSVTKIPQTPAFMRGVINLRGGVVPVVDLKEKFMMGKTEKTINTCVIVTEVAIGEEPVILGIMADAVDEVFDLASEQVEPAPKIGTHLNTEFLLGMGKKDNEFILLLDIDRIFTLDELSQVTAAGTKAVEDEAAGS